VTSATTFTTVITHLATAATVGTSSITVNGVTGIASGDDVLIVNVRSTLGNDGYWEVARISSVGGTTFTLSQTLANSYPEPANTVVQRIPQYSTVNITGALSVAAWSPTALNGGIVAFAASGAVTIGTGGSINVAGLGYTGGVANSIDINPGEYKLPGESYLGLGAVGMTDVANGGGGGGGFKQNGCEGSGGGGGSYSTSGTGGGREQVNCNPPGFPGGVPGNTYGDSTLTRIYFGSGGGAGGWSNQSNLGSGGAGGGMVLIFGTGSVTITGGIDADGANGENESTGAGADYGGGGGGAGGSVYLQGSSVTGVTNVTVGGGTGGQTNVATNVEVGGNGGLGFVYTE
jgi:hypothetical protein